MNIELSLLAAMLYYGDFTPLTKGDIVAEHFETDQGQTIHEFITTYRGETDGQATYPSLGIVRNRFRSSGIELPDPEPGAKIAALVYETRLARFCSELRQFASNAEAIATTSSNPMGEALPLIAALRRAAETSQQCDHISMAKGLHGIVENYRKREILPEGIPWPWPIMNAATRGLQRKECYGIVGRPKSRKTFTALRIGTHAYKHHGLRVLIFTPEMPVRQIFLRCVAHLCDLHYTEFKAGEMQQAEEARLFEAAENYGRYEGTDDVSYQLQMKEVYPGLKYDQLPPSLDIVQSTQRDTAWMSGQIELYQPDLVIVDSVYRHRGVGQKKNDSDWKAVTAVSREMKDLAMQLNVAMILTTQLNRGAQKSIGDISNIGFADALAADMDGIWRVITGKIEGNDVSALVSYAAREVDHDGILIRNAPCYDYSEIGKITDRKQVEDLLLQEDKANRKEENDRIRNKVREGGGDAAAAGAAAPHIVRASKTQRSGLVQYAQAYKGKTNAFHQAVAERIARAG